MTYPQAIVIAAVLIAGAIVVTDNPAQSSPDDGAYRMTDPVMLMQRPYAFRIHTLTGRVDVCTSKECWKVE